MKLNGISLNSLRFQQLPLNYLDRWSRRENTDHANKLTLYLRSDGRFGCYMRSDYILPSFLLLIFFFCYCFIDCLFFCLEVSGVFCIVIINYYFLKYIFLFKNIL